MQEGIKTVKSYALDFIDLLYYYNIIYLLI